MGLRLKMFSNRKVFRLNPYSNGRFSMGTANISIITLVSCPNPYSNGRYSMGDMANDYADKTLCLNPYSNGRYSMGTNPLDDFYVVYAS